MLIAIATLLATAQVDYSPADKTGSCAKADKVNISPADMVQLLDDFRSGLVESDRERLDHALPRGAGGGIAQCDTAEGSRASCEAAAYMPALRSTGLMPSFLATICPRKGGAPAAATADHSAPTFIPHHAMPPR